MDLAMQHMTAVTTVPGFGAPVHTPRHRCAPRAATPRGGRVSRATYRRRRLVAGVLVLAAVVVAGEAGSALGGPPLATPERRPNPSIVVRDGDTLWTIVERARPGEDPRPHVDRLSAAREGAPLVPGETIRLSG